MKKILSVALVVVLLAGIAVSGTMAYLQDSDSDVNVMTLGNVEIDQIEQERDENGDLQEFTQDKPLYPAVYDDTSIPWAAEEKWVVPKEQAWKVVKDNENVVDKFVTVKNTGKSDAYVRTLIAYEGDETYGPEGAYIHVVHNGSNVNPAITINMLGVYSIKEVEYTVYEYVYPEALAAGETSIPSLKQVYLDKTATNEVCEVYGDTYEILVLSQAVQTNGFADAATALETAFPKGADYANVVAWFENLPSDEADTWDGTADTTWYNETDTEFNLTTSEQLAGLADLVDGGNTFAGKTIKLGTDIDLYAEDENGERVSFDPIGYGYDVVFKGTFDGQDHTIKNLYQNGWALGMSYSTEGGGLFASVVDATIKNVNIDNAEVVMECIDMGVLVGYSYGNCTYENINVTNSTIANYQRYTGGVVGEVNGIQTFKNVDVKDTVISSLWGDFDCSLGGIVGGKYGEATLTFEDCDVACELNAYNDVTSSYQWYAYRRAGMLIGNSEETKTEDGRTSATASYLTAKNCTVTYGDWANYTYCEFAGTSWPYVRVQAGYSCDAYSNPRYGVATDANGNKAVDDTHVHNEGEDHNILLTFDQLFGGGQGVYGTATHDGVTVKYPN